MKQTVAFSVEQNQQASAEVEIPDECPVCERLVLLSPSLQAYNKDKGELQIVFWCPNKNCNSLLIAYYRGEKPTVLSFLKIEPPNLKKDELPEFVAEISSTFVSIHLEAHEAKQRGLSQIAGPGYRKAFEFLIKDYAKSISPPDKHSEIENTFAGSVVSNYIPDKRIQAVAKRALWLGNDETHYLRKWEQHDINDLITLISLTISWIQIERQSKEYVDEMPE
jgi:hypothetical protein